MADSDEQRELAMRQELEQLRERSRQAEEEVGVLRRRLSEGPGRVQSLEERMLEAKGQLAQAISQNEKLTYTLQQAKEHIAALREEVDKLTQPPSAYGTFLHANEDGTIDVFSGGRKMRVAVHPEIEAEELRRGQEVVLNESLNVVLARDGEDSGEVVTLKEILEDGRRAIVYARADEERVVELSDELAGVRLRTGDTLLMDTRSQLLIEKLPRPEVEELVLEEVPDITYADVGGLDTQIEAITDAVELPYLHRRLFAHYKLPAPKGILLYGPPGCGKTLIAKAVANSLAKKVAETTNNASIRSYFLNIKGPELLNKYVGETERQIRLVFQRAREKAEEGVPVIVFFDEMDSLFRTRGTGISSDMESTIVPQLLAEIDGVEALRDVIVIGASNRRRSASSLERLPLGSFSVRGEQVGPPVLDGIRKMTDEGRVADVDERGQHDSDEHHGHRVPTHVEVPGPPRCRQQPLDQDRTIERRDRDHVEHGQPHVDQAEVDEHFGPQPWLATGVECVDSPE